MRQEIRVTFSNGERYVFPVTIVANDYARFAARRNSTLHGQDFDVAFDTAYDEIINDEQGLIRWLNKNMEWDDVYLYARRLPSEVPEISYAEEFYKAPKTIERAYEGF